MITVRQDFPFQGVYLDTAATAQKPKAMLEALYKAYTHDYGNVHRSAGAGSTSRYEKARKTVESFLGPSNDYALVWVANATMGMNILAQQWHRHF